MSTRNSMFLVQLILSGNQQERLEVASKIIKKALGISFLEKKHPDLILLEAENSLGIKEIRALQQQISLKPYSAPVKVALIPQAGKLTVPAQNALLKTLEEPPAQTLIILLAPKKEALLPTIISRCQITQLVQKPQIEADKKFITHHSSLITHVLESSPGERIRLAQKYGQRQGALSLAENLLLLWREVLLIKTGVKEGNSEKKLKSLSLFQIQKIIENTETIRLMLAANINPRLAIENLFLSYPNPT